MGKESILLRELLSDPDHSLIKQSKYAKEGTYGINADGLGIGWYDHSIDDTPGLYKSTQPAWNDHNLLHLISKIRSNCFLGHVRSSTVGDVNIFNCHPFSHGNFSFCHNGTIRGFEHIKRKLLGSLSNTYFNCIKGQTDSEHLFALILDILTQSKKKITLHDIASAITHSFEKIRHLQNTLTPDDHAKLNVILTNGYHLVATRYTSDNLAEPLSLYYKSNISSSGANSIYIASEPLNDSSSWQAIPKNHMLLIDSDLNIEINPL